MASGRQLTNEEFIKKYGIKILYYTKYKVNGNSIVKNNKELINKITYGF